MNDTPERYARIEAAFAAARVAPAEERSSILDAHFGSDSELRAEVEALLLTGLPEAALLSDGAIRDARSRIDGLLDKDAEGDPAALWQPDEVAGYQILRRIGEGGMGIVFEAEQQSPRRRVALKLVHPQRTSAERLKRLEHEAELLGRLAHPGIARIYASGEFDTGHGVQPFFAMELVEGQALRSHVESKRLGLKGILLLVAQVADAIQHAHERGVIHRDLKPENILVDALGQPRVLDFGVARGTDGSDIMSTFMTETGAVIGTLAYMAPEQLLGKSAQLSPRTDVYALGVILFELLSGRLPHLVAGMDLPTAIRLRGQAPSVRLSSLDRTIPTDVETIVHRALEVEPSRRYESAEALSADLRRFLGSEPIAARPPTRIYLARTFVRRHRALAFSTFSVVLALFLGLTASVVQFMRAQAAAELADSRYEEVLQLADLKRIRDAEAVAETLWPVGPEIEEELRDWLRDHAAPLRERLPRHRATLDDLRQNAESTELAGAVQRFVLRSEPLQWQHDALVELIAALETFLDRDPFVGAVASVEQRLERALRIEQETTVGSGVAARWKAALSDIARLECYHGLQLTPQVGIVPLRRDPRSGLWEFWHAGSGSEPVLGPDDTWVMEGTTGIVLALVPGGKTWLGAQGEDEAGLHYDPFAEEDEGPVHPVQLDAFFLSKYEMTQAQWERATGTRPSNYGATYRWSVREAGGASPHVNGPVNPVEQVSWTDCDRVLRQLGLALPTEAQWEHGARGGTSTPWWSGSQAASIGEKRAGNVADARSQDLGAPSGWPFEAWDDPWIVHSPVGSFAPNPYGLHDTLGNLFEWCADRRTSYRQSAGPGSGQRAHLAEDDRYIARGGSFGLSAVVARSAVRFSYTPEYRNDLVGVRPAMGIR